MLKFSQQSGITAEQHGWLWGIFASARPTSVDHKFQIYAPDQATPIATWTFPAAVPGNIMFTQPIKLDGNFIYASNSTDSISYTYYILTSNSPREMGAL